MDIRNKHEAIFQKYLIDSLAKIGCQAMHIEPVGHPGFPDLLVTAEERYMLVELKSIAKITSAKFGSIFEDGQLSWHLNRMERNSRPVMTLIEVRELKRAYIFLPKEPSGYLYASQEKISDLLEACPYEYLPLLADWLKARI